MASTRTNAVAIRGIDGRKRGGRPRHAGSHELQSGGALLIDDVQVFEAARMWNVRPSADARETQRLYATVHIHGEDLEARLPWPSSLVTGVHPNDSLRCSAYRQ